MKFLVNGQLQRSVELASCQLRQEIKDTMVKTLSTKATIHVAKKISNTWLVDFSRSPVTSCKLQLTDYLISPRPVVHFLAPFVAPIQHPVAEAVAEAVAVANG